HVAESEFLGHESSDLLALRHLSRARYRSHRVALSATLCRLAALRKTSRVGTPDVAVAPPRACTRADSSRRCEAASESRAAARERWDECDERRPLRRLWPQRSSSR